MEDYFSTNIASNLEKIFLESLDKNNLTLEDATIIVENKVYSKNNVRLLVNSCISTVDTYVNIYGGLCKGELKYVGANILNVYPYDFEERIIEQQSQNTDFKSLKYFLKEIGIDSTKLNSIISAFDEPKMLIYKQITNPKHDVWFKDVDLGKLYVENFLTSPNLVIINKNLNQKNNIYAIEAEKARIDNGLSKKRHLNTNILCAADNILKKYDLDNSIDSSLHTIKHQEISRLLLENGLDDINTRVYLVARCFTDKKFSSLFKVPGTSDYSAKKIAALAKIYSSKEYVIQNFLADIQTIFNK